MDEMITCPQCGARRLVLRYEVSYVYSYVLDDNAPGRANEAYFHPYAYDERTQKAAEQYVECTACQAKFPCYLQKADVSLQHLKENLRSCAENNVKSQSEV